MQQIIWSLQITLTLGFLIFSFIPIFWFIFILFFSNLSIYYMLFFVSTVLLTILGLIAIFGILTLRLGFRPFVTVFFSCGIFFWIENPYLLTLGVILSWMFYEIWFISYKYHQLNQEYANYPSNSMERQKLLKTFQSQFGSTFVLAWIVLSISWGILLIGHNFYIELGTGEYGTLGITISVAIILLIYLVQKHIRSSTKNFI